jgi:NADPH2:quinone reductase
MRTAVCNEYGPPESLGNVELADPPASAGEVVAEIKFAAANYQDVLILANKYQASAPLPFIPGSEFSGIVTSVALNSVAERPSNGNVLLRIGARTA